MTNWERRIRHLDRKVKPIAASKMGVRRQLLKAKVKERRGRPSRNLPIELVFERLEVRLEAPDAAGRTARLHRAEIHERLMERKRRKRDAARHRARPRVTDTGIYLWRRRQQWLRDVESVDEESDEMGSDEIEL